MARSLAQVRLCSRWCTTTCGGLGRSLCPLGRLRAAFVGCALCGLPGRTVAPPLSAALLCPFHILGLVLFRWTLFFPLSSVHPVCFTLRACSLSVPTPASDPTPRSLPTGCPSCALPPSTFRTPSTTVLCPRFARSAAPWLVVYIVFITIFFRSIRFIPAISVAQSTTLFPIFLPAGSRRNFLITTLSRLFAIFRIFCTVVPGKRWALRICCRVNCFGVGLLWHDIRFGFCALTSLCLHFL
mmetsp:Transcript_27177/g.74734  ORF Transcript_27177/g.74734 Transcript_27177/m.74734 type:complete len:241 (-) Transcript_27177:1172-1894(-)